MPMSIDSLLDEEMSESAMPQIATNKTPTKRFYEVEHCKQQESKNQLSGKEVMRGCLVFVGEFVFLVVLLTTMGMLLGHEFDKKVSDFYDFVQTSRGQFVGFIILAIMLKIAFPKIKLW